MRSHAFLISFGLASLTGCSALVGIEDATLRTSTGGSAGAAGSAVAGTAGSAGGGAASGAAGAVAGRGGSGGEAGNTGGMGGSGGKTDAGSGGIAGAAGIGGAGNAGNGGAGNAGSGGGGNAGSGGAGTGGSAGAGNGGAGAAGSAGSSGANAGNGGAAGIGGGGAGGAVQGGAAGNAGQAGNAGNAGTAGSAGTAGNGGSAGSGAVTITSFGTGIQHACAARSDGSLWCWGANVHGQLGSGQPGGKSVPAKVALQDVAAVAVGITHTCALAKNGDLRCWGENGGGQCGLGFETPSVTTPPVNPILKNVSAVYSASRGTTCAVQNDQVLCWGRRLDGQSSGGNSHTSTPTLQTGLRSGTVHRVSVGSEVGCALIGDRVQCWGRGGPGVGAGPGVPNAYFPPADIVKPTSALAGVHVGDLSALAWTASGELFAWGGNGNKQLGFDGPNDGTPQAVIVSAGLDAPVVAAASGFRSSCAIGGVDRRVRCWGGNGHGQIGASLGPGGEYLPSKNVLFQDGGSLAPLSAHAIDVGWEEACATSVDRERMYCWGAGESGQLGDGTIGDSTIAVPVALP